MQSTAVRPEAGSLHDAEAGLMALHELLEQGDVEGARRLVKELAQQWPDHERIQHMARVLERPRAFVGPPGPRLNLDRQREWLTAHAHESSGCWLAVGPEGLLAADPSERAALEKARESVPVEDIVLYYRM